MEKQFMNAAANVTPMVSRHMEPLPAEEIPKELQDQLRAPLPAEAITSNDKHAHLSSIKPGYVIERMLDVFGVGGWQERYDEISRSESKKIYKKGTPDERSVTLHVAVVKGYLTIPRYGIHLEQFGGSENETPGDELKGACTDAFTKCCSHLGIGLEVYKGAHDKPRADRAKNPSCLNPNCKRELFKDKESDGFFCWKAKGGCGAKWTAAQIAAKEQPPDKKAPASAPDQPKQKPIDVEEKITIQGELNGNKREGDTLLVKVGQRICGTMDKEIERRLVAAPKGTIAELLVSQFPSEKYTVLHKIHKIIQLRSVKEASHEAV
jgi:Rad52/22 family double-strand break repair protein